MANKTVKKMSEDKVLASLCDELELHFETKKEADGEIKAIKEKIVEIVNKNKKKYFDGKKSFVIGSIAITLKEDNTYSVGEDFDLATFWSRYPDAVKFSISHSGVKNIDLEKWEIEHNATEKIDVALKPVKK